MDRTLLDALRCPAPHAEGWLVAVVHAADGPRLQEAELACPACGAAFVVRGGVARFHEPSVPREPAPPPVAGAMPHADRLAALLGVADGPHPVLLVGARTAEGAALAARVTPPQWWLNPPAPVPAPPADPALLAAVLHVGVRWPLASRVVAAVAVDGAHATPEALAEAARVLRAGGRLVAPASAPLPAGVRELVRDDAEWVAEATGPTGGLVALRRRQP